MDAAIQRLVDDVVVACTGGDNVSFCSALSLFKQRVVASPSRTSIGPGVAFGVLAPAGDAIGRALCAAGAERALPLLDLLARDETAEVRSVACRALAHVGTLYSDDVVALAHLLAGDGSWEVREFIANALDEVMAAAQPDFVFSLMQQWVHDPDANVRRVPTNALMRYGRINPQHVIGLMKNLLHDDSRYVRENVVFCLSIMGATRVRAIGGAAHAEYPAQLLATLRQWADDGDERTRWIIAKTLGRKWTKACPHDALGLLHLLAADERRAVRVAVGSSVKALAKTSPAETPPALAQWADAQDRGVRGPAAEI